MSLTPNRSTVVTEDGSRLAVFTSAPHGLADDTPISCRTVGRWITVPGILSSSVSSAPAVCTS